MPVASHLKEARFVWNPSFRNFSLTPSSVVPCCRLVMVVTHHAQKQDMAKLFALGEPWSRLKNR